MFSAKENGNTDPGSPGVCGAVADYLAGCLGTEISESPGRPV